MEGNHQDAREWLALSVPALHAAANEIVRPLTRRGDSATDVSVTAQYARNAMKHLHEAQEHIMRALVILEAK